MINTDTIAAISTPLGEGGISIIRLSGSRAIEIADEIFIPSGKNERPALYESHTVHYGHIKPFGKDEIVDEVLLTVMKAPKTYTAEDVVEINCHGGVVSSKKVLEFCLAQGARPAQCGEFTKRAFLNGRIDLSQAEAVLDIIRSETDMAQKAALSQLGGGFSKRIHNIKNTLIDVLSLIELGIDFSEEDVEFSSGEGIMRRVNSALQVVTEMLETFDDGMILREGANVVICGRPNVGKSSIMNALLKQDRVIVTPTAGTTRDVIEESVSLDGIKVRLSDTAGITKARSRAESEGIKRSRGRLSTADVALFVLDISRPLSDDDIGIYRKIRNKKKVIVANKSDLAAKLDMKKTGEVLGQEDILEISALKKKGLRNLEKTISGKLFNRVGESEEGLLVTNARHRKLLTEIHRSLKRAAKAPDNGGNAELLANDIRDAADQLGFIVGESIGDDVLDRIFSQFCIGK